MSESDFTTFEDSIIQFTNGTNDSIAECETTFYVMYGVQFQTANDILLNNTCFSVPDDTTISDVTTTQSNTSPTTTSLSSPCDFSEFIANISDNAMEYRTLYRQLQSDELELYTQDSTNQNAFAEYGVDAACQILFDGIVPIEPVHSAFQTCIRNNGQLFTNATYNINTLIQTAVSTCNESVSIFKILECKKNYIVIYNRPSLYPM